MTFSEKAIRFAEEVQYTGKQLPTGIRVMNPYREAGQTMQIVRTFYNKFYNDNNQRNLILGINPGRLGSGITGISFTDPKRLISACGIPYTGQMSHETSSVFIYDMIAAYGGVERFYQDFYINSPCPLGFTSVAANGKETNYNYYDSKELLEAVKPFMVNSLKTLVGMGVNTERCFCLGTGKNKAYLDKLNLEYGFFKEIIPLEHPRFIMQYRLSQKQFYIDKYLEAFHNSKR